jgi:5-methylcytosine-specific restriction protein B
MMNTADRAIALVDYALRRRFGFINVLPAFDKPQFKVLLFRKGLSNSMVVRIVEKISALNEVITNAPQLGNGFVVGHSYFIPPNYIYDEESSDYWYQNVIRYEIRPLLMEYWFDDISTAEELVADLLV